MIEREKGGRFRKGVSGNPGGRAKSDVAAREYAKGRSKRTLQRLDAIAEDPKMPAASRVRANEVLAAYGLGKPATVDFNSPAKPGQMKVQVEFVKARDGRPADDLPPLTPPKVFRLPPPNPSNVGRLPPAKVAN